MAATCYACQHEPAEPKAKCTVATDDAAWQANETLCDGLDNDCDGFTDVLYPWAVNRCTSDGKGVCGVGWAVCEGEKRVCKTGSKHIETHDGLDNDCDGKVDNVADVSVKTMRVRIAVPPDVQGDDRPHMGSLQSRKAELEQKLKAATNYNLKKELQRKIDWMDTRIRGLLWQAQYEQLVDKLVASNDPAVHKAIEIKMTELWRKADPKDPKDKGKLEKLHVPENRLVFAHALDQVGVPYEMWVPSAESPQEELEADWINVLKTLDKYRMVIVPGFLSPGWLNPQFGHLDRLRKWVSNGGVLVWTKVIGPGPTDDEESTKNAMDVLALAGVGAPVSRPNIFSVRIQNDTPATRWLDSPQERNIKLMDNTASWRHEVFTYPLLPGKGAVPIATAHTESGKSQGATWIYRKLGKGAVYTFGWNVLDYTMPRCYVNCFDPGTDVGAMLLKGIYAEATGGHYVVRHTVPGTEDGVLISSHDVDAPDAFLSGPWGQPGLLRMAEMEKKHGIAGTYFITTDYVTDYFLPSTFEKFMDIGQNPAGGHSIQHFDWTEFPHGLCDVDRKTYAPKQPSVCAEVRVNLQILRGLVGLDRRLDAWRTPYLETNHYQYRILSDAGIKYDSSLAAGDVRTNFPIDLPTFQYYNKERVPRSRPMWVFPVVLEDGIGWYEPDGTEMREELTRARWHKFRSLWVDALVGNMRNGAWTVILVHPSYGVGKGVVPANVQMKIDATDFGIRFAQGWGLHIADINTLGDFWADRQSVRLSGLTYDPKDGYKGTLETTTRDASNFSLEFGDVIAGIQCTTCGKIRVEGRRAVFELLPKGKKHLFRAALKPSPAK